MRRGVTVLVVVVVAAIALAAGFDALRGDEGSQPPADTRPEPPSTSTAETPEAPASEQERFAGVLYYTDESCQLRAAQLPDLEPAEAPNWDECRFALSPDARRVSGVGSGWDPHSDPRRGRLFQSADGSIQVSTNGGPEGEPFRGEAPAWRPGGSLTYLRDDALREWPTGEVVLSEREIVREFRSQLYDVARAEVEEVAWMGDERLALIVAMESPGEPDRDVVAIFMRRHLVGVGAGDSESLSDLRASPQGNFVAVTSPQSFELLTPDGRNAGAPPLTDVRAIAFSPDERWVAAATDGGVYVFRPGRGEWTERFDLDAQDLDWRGEVGPPPLVDADEVRDWLGGVGGTGRLFVTLPGCRLRALRLPDLVWEEEPNVPAPCRFALTPADAPLDEAISVSPTGELRASCEGGGLRIFQNSGFRAQLQGACSPAWMGDGTLTFVRNGGLWQGIEDAQLLVSREQISEIFGRPSALEEVAWLDDERFWAVVRSGESAIVALLTTDNLVFSPSFTARKIEGLRVSATGMVAARTDQGVVFFDSGGRRALTFPNGRAVAWAPGELFAAVATPSEVLFVAPVSREVVPISLEVSDLEWVVP
jgi:hypothetical protein